LNKTLNTLLKSIKDKYPEEYSKILANEDYKKSCNLTKYSILEGIILKKLLGI